MLKDDTPDTGSGLKLFNREAFLQLPYFDHMHRFLPALVLRNGGRVISVEVSHRERKRGRSKYGLHDRLWVGVVDILGVMWLQRRFKKPVLERKE
jgi:dolichol-phosphate mannosyltransferase